jgi:hypothetical protein
MFLLVLYNNYILMSAALIHKTIYLADDAFVVYFPRRATGKQLAAYLQHILRGQHVYVVSNGMDIVPLEQTDTNEWAHLYTVMAASSGKPSVPFFAKFAPILDETKAHVISCEERKLSSRQYKKWRETEPKDFERHVLELEGQSAVSAYVPAGAGHVQFGKDEIKQFSKRASALTMAGKSGYAKQEKKTEILMQYGLQGVVPQPVPAGTLYEGDGLLALKLKPTMFDKITMHNCARVFLPTLLVEPSIKVAVYNTSSLSTSFSSTFCTSIYGLTGSVLNNLQTLFTQLSNCQLMPSITAMDDLVYYKNRLVFKSPAKFHFVDKKFDAFVVFNLAWKVPIHIQESINRYVKRVFNKNTAHAQAQIDTKKRLESVNVQDIIKKLV